MPLSRVLPRRALAAAALLLAAGCGSDDPTYPPQNVFLGAITFGGYSADPAAADVTDVSAGTAPGTIRVHGTIKLPGSCYDMLARVSATNQFVMVYVTGERRAAGCVAQATQVAYDLTVQGAYAGQHTVSVRHEVEQGLQVVSTDVALVDVTVK